MRVNCVDCLDRTNNAMACIASVVFAEMLKSLKVDFDDFYSPTTNAVTSELLQFTLNLFGVSFDYSRPTATRSLSSMQDLMLFIRRKYTRTTKAPGRL